MSFFKKIFSKEKKETLDKGLEKSKSSFFNKLITLFFFYTQFLFFFYSSQLNRDLNFSRIELFSFLISLIDGECSVRSHTSAPNCLRVRSRPLLNTAMPRCSACSNSNPDTTIRMPLRGDVFMSCRSWKFEDSV